MAPSDLIIRPASNMVERMDTSTGEHDEAVANNIDSSVGSMLKTNNANRGEDVCGIRQDDMNPAGQLCVNFVNQVNATVGRARAQIQRRQMRDLQLNHYYKFMAIQLVNTRQYGEQVIARLISPEENVEFKVFLPPRMVRLFPDETVVQDFLSSVTGLKVLSLAENNSVNLEFLNNREPGDGGNINSVPESFNNEEFLMSAETLNTATRDELKNQLIRLRAEKQCRICLDANKTVVFSCGHGACRRCAESIRECHICR